MNKVEVQTGQVFLIQDFLSQNECEALIDFAESRGFSPAPIATLAGPQMAPEIRNNSRIIVDDPLLAKKLFERAREFLPESLDRAQLLGFNERWRFYRYQSGQRFARHFDSSFRRNRNEASKLTFLIYLNEEFNGGSTRFFLDPEANVEPKRGTALVFVHRKLHEGVEIISGTKYVLRTDVMYINQPLLPVKETILQAFWNRTDS